jgi:1-deoxy-D-xylulose-5-phosphate reductoisomerase
MKKKIAILGSTGSIGKTTVDIIKNDKKNFEILLLTTNDNLNELTKQIRELKPKNIIINNKNNYLKLKKKFNKINIFNNFDIFLKKNKKKIDYTISAISGLSGLQPTLDIIKHSKTIAIANKESIICAWNLIEKNLKANNTKFIPVDSEHFSIWYLLQNKKIQNVEEIIITASGGPFLNWKLSKIKTASPNIAIKHPNWSMGKKISIDSATMMNKVFELIEAQRIFNLDRVKFKILIHPQSLVHAIVKFDNGLTKLLIHDTDMKIPIFNSVYDNRNKKINNKKIDYSSLNNLSFKSIDLKKFPSIKILKKIPKKISLFETILVSVNDELVDLFLKKKIKFWEIYTNLNKLLNMKEFIKYKRIKPKNTRQIYKLSEYVRLKTRVLSIRSSK